MIMNKHIPNITCAMLSSTVVFPFPRLLCADIVLSEQKYDIQDEGVELCHVNYKEIPLIITFNSWNILIQEINN